MGAWKRRKLNHIAAPAAYQPVTVRTVTSRRDRARFLDVARRVYRDDPNWVAPLDVERSDAWSDRQPFFRHARWRRWLAERDGEVVGRISAQIDALHVERHGPTGFFGLIEALDDPESWAELLAVACEWLRGEGMERVRGPMDLGINQQLGVLVEGFESPPYFMMGHARRYYGQRLAELGFVGVKDLLAYIISPHFERPAVYRKLLDRMGTRLVVRPLDRRRLDAELETLRSIFNDAWANNWGFVPFTEEEFRALGREMMLILPRDYVHIAEVDGEAAAFIVVLPNVNEAIHDLGGRLLPFGWAKALWRLKVRGPGTARVPLMGVRQAFQHTRYGPALAFAVIEATARAVAGRGVEWVELSWILEDNRGMRNIIESIGGRVSKRYRVYEKSLV